MITKMIEAVNEARFGKERLRRELLRVQANLDNYKTIAASANARAKYAEAQYKYYLKNFQDGEEANGILQTQLRDQQTYTMACVKKLNEARRVAEWLSGISQLPGDAK